MTVADEEQNLDAMTCSKIDLLRDAKTRLRKVGRTG